MNPQIQIADPATPLVGHNNKTISQQINKLKIETNAATQEMTDYVFAQKAQFIQKMQDHLVEIRRDLDRLSSAIGASNDAAKAEAEPKLQALRDQADKLTGQLNEATGAHESVWNDVKVVCNNTYIETKNCIQQSRQ